MKKNFFICLIIAVLLACFNSPALYADDPKVSAAVDKQTAYQNQEIGFSIRISDGKGNIPAPRLPNFKGFDTFYSGRASHFTFINGKSSSAVEFNYVLIPKSVGVFRLDPVSIVIDGKSYQTDPIQVEVLGKPALLPQMPAQHAPLPQQPPIAAPYPTQPTSGRQPQSSFVSPTDDDNIFLRVNANKRTVYSNEQILLTYSLLTRYDTRFEGFETEPETSGFWVEEIPLEPRDPRQTEVINGKRYMRADVKKLALFPTAPGEYIVKPGSGKASVQIDETPSNFLDEFFNDSFFNRTGVFARQVEKSLPAPPITVVVKPLPAQGKPKSFQGAVGEFRLSAVIDKQEVKQNEPVTLQVTIEGEGNVETLRHPDIPESSDVKMYDADTKSEFFKVDNAIAGKKVFEIIFIPKRAGMLEIPGLEFSFFNPRSEQYMTLKTDAHQVHVTPSLSPLPELPKELGQAQFPDKKEVQVVGKDIRYIQERLKQRSPARNFLFYLLLTINGVLTMIAFTLLVKNRQEQFLNANIVLKRDRLAKKNAQKLLQKLNHFSKKGDSEHQKVFFDDVERLMNQYLADKLNLSPGGLTHEMVSERLSARNVSPEIIKKIQEFYDICGLVRFGRAEAFEAKSDEIIKTVQAILKEDF
ncbi:MAG: protein BatD [Candidatus Omnitrophica bacterium]|nr:protein BatD [Candidatus Omnitrophota bacterium]